MGCFAGGLAIVLNGILSVVDIFEVFDEPIYYVVNACLLINYIRFQWILYGLF